MAEKKIQTRIRQKVDTKANWDKATNFIPLKGEIIIYSDLNQAKVGDGTTKVGALPFLKGKADASDKNPTLAWGSKSTVATVDGVDIHVTMPSNPNTHQSIKALNTNNTSAQTASSSEAIAGSGTINLHKVAKTGSYNDLNNKPTIPTVPSNIVKYTNHTVGVAGTNKTVAAVSPSALYVANGLIMGGTAAAAGLVTRGICGVMTPDNTGACAKENLYLNYDGDNNYLRKVVLGAGSPGDSIAGGATTFSAVRGDQMVGYVNSLALIKSGKQTTTSTADGGSNVYTFTDTKGATSTFTVKNGSKGSTGSVASFKAGSGSGNVITGLKLNSDKSVTYDKAVNALDMGTSSTSVNQVVYNPVEMKKALIAPSLTVGDIKNAAMVSTDANGKLIKSNLPAAFEQISVIDKTIQYNDNIEVTEVYLSCEGMESYYKWDKLVFSAPGSPAASNIKYYYNYMGQKKELTPTNASALNSVLDSYGESIVVAINRDESNPTITYLPNGLVLGRGYYSTEDGSVFTYYVYDAPQGSMPALREIAPDTSTFLDKGTASTTDTQTVYNPVEMKKALTVSSVQGTKYTDNSGNQQSLFELGGTADTNSGSSSLTLYRNRAGNWDSASITFTPADGLKINNYAIGVQNWSNVPASYILTNGDGVTKDSNGGVKLKSSGGASSDDFVFESTNNGKLHSKMSIGPSGLVRGGWCIDNSKIITEATLGSAVGSISSESIVSICI